MALPVAVILAGIETAMKLIPVAEKLFNVINSAFKKAKEAGTELTPEQEAAYQRLQSVILGSPQAQIEPNPGSSPH